MLNPDDWFLERDVAEAIRNAPQGSTPEQIAALVIAAMASDTWVVTEENYHAGKPSALKAVDEFGAAKADMISCTHYWHYVNGSLATTPETNRDEDIDYMHMCSIDDKIAELVALRELRRRFEAGEQFPGCAHSSLEYTKPERGDQPHPCQACGTVGDRTTPPTPPKRRDSTVPEPPRQGPLTLTEHVQNEAQQRTTNMMTNLMLYGTLDATQAPTPPNYTGLLSMLDSAAALERSLDLGLGVAAMATLERATRAGDELRAKTHWKREDYDLGVYKVADGTGEECIVL